MSYRPTIGGKLREVTSGVDRSQAVFACWGPDPEKEIGQTCELNVIMRRRATSDRSVVTAAKLVYSTWKITPPGERNEKAIYRHRPASESVYLLYSIGERADVCDRLGAGRSGAVCEQTAAARGRGGGGDHLQHAAVLRQGGAAGSARGGSRHQSVPRDQSIGEEDRHQRCAAAGTLSFQGAAAGGADEG